MSFSMNWHGVEELEAAFARKSEAVTAATREAVVEAASATQAAMRAHAVEGGSHGEGTPTPAGRGGGPARISGTLSGSIQVSPVESWGAGGAMALVGPTAIYARRVELGYGYAFTGPGFEEVAPLLPAIFARAWAQALSR